MNTYKFCKVCQGAITTLNKKYDLVICDKCSLIFCRQKFTQEEIVKVYDKLYSDKESHYKRHIQDEFNALLSNKKQHIGFHRTRLINKFILNSKCQSVLEVGSGIGLIGAYLKEKNSNLDYLGIEIDEHAYKKSQEIGINAKHGDFELMKGLTQKFDVIMLWEVIEHLQDLKQFVELAYNRLADGGIIIFSAPNYNRIFNYSNKDPDNIYQDAPPVHLNFFTKTSVKSIFEYIGFRNIKVKIKRFPYLELNRRRFYMLSIKTLIGKYFGPTLYVVAQK